jgi:hypothetical protein
MILLNKNSNHIINQWILDLWKMTIYTIIKNICKKVINRFLIY